MDKTNGEPFGGANKAEDLRLFLMIAMIHSASSKGDISEVVEEALSDFKLMDSINDPAHLATASRLMLRHEPTFFSLQAATVLRGDDADAKKALMAQVRPYVQVTWHMCVLLCRELIRGDHPLSPRDALMFGLVDEVPGDSVIESRRRFRVRRERESAAGQVPPPRVRRLRSTQVNRRQT